MRSVENKLIHITCDKGTQQETNKRISPVGTFSLVQNMRINGQGVMQKRHGTRAFGSVLATAGTTDDPVNEPSFISRAGSTGIVGRSDGFAYQHIDDTSGANQDALQIQGRFSTCLPVRKRFGIMGSELGSTAGYGGKSPAIAVASNGYVLVAAISDGDDLYAFCESPDGVRTFVKRIDNQTVVQVRAVAYGAIFMLVWQVGTTITAQAIDPLGGGVGAATSITPSLPSGGYWDATSYDGSAWYIGYNFAGPLIRVSKMTGVTGVTTSLTAETSITGNPPDPIAPMSLYGDATNSLVWLGWYDSGQDVDYAVFNASTMASVLGATTIATVSDAGPPLFGRYRFLANSATFIYRSVASGTSRGTVWGVATTSVAVVGATLSNVIPISKPDSDMRFWAVTDANSSNFLLARTVLLRIPSDTSQSIPTVELASPRMEWVGNTYSASQNPQFFHATAEGSDSHMFAFPWVLAKFGDNPLVKVEVYEYQTTTDYPHRDVVPAGATTFVAGQPTELFAQPRGTVLNSNGSPIPGSYFSGAAEVGFVETPLIVSSSASSGSGVGVGSYSYRAVFEWADAYGRRHQSAPSAPFEVTLSQARDVVLTLRSCNVTQRVSAYAPISTPRTVIYRTVSGGTNYHRLPGSGTTSFTDNFSDDSIDDEPFLYTDGNVLENDLAPSCRFMRFVASRLWCGGLWDPTIIECSKVAVPEEQLAFTGDPSHQVPVGADCTGLAVMDDQLVVFTADGILTVVGEGPNDQGIGAFGTRTVSVGVGCSDYRSIVETDLGVIFLGRRGFYLLPRGFGPPQYIGAMVQDTFASYPTCLAGAAWHGNGANLARFLMSDGSTGRVTLDFDVDKAVWYVSTYAQRNNELGAWPSGWVLCAADLDSDTTPRPLLVEDTSKVADAVHASSTGSHIEQRATTNWITPAGPGGWATVQKFLGAVVPLATAKLHLAVYMDTDASLETSSWDIAGSEEIAYRYLLPSDPHGVSFRASIYDSAPTGGPSRGMQFLAITLEFEPDGGVRPPNYGEQS